MNSGWIIPLIVIVVLGIGGFVVYQTVKQKIEGISMAAFGTKSLSEGLERQADILAETPKSVSGMTRVFEPQIQRDFPEFHTAQFRNKAENMLTAALEAITAENTAKIKEASDMLRDQVENRIMDNKAAGVKEIYSQIRIHQTEITNYEKKDGKCVITFQSAVEHYHYTEYRSGKKSGTVAKGEKERKQQTKYNMEWVYIQDAKLAKTDNAKGTVCPNCGAPVTNLGNMYCEYCGTAVTPLNIKVWSLHRYYEVDYNHV